MPNHVLGPISCWSFKIMAKVMMTNLMIFVAADYTLTDQQTRDLVKV